MASKILACWIVGNLSLCVLWDITVLVLGVEQPTVSSYIYDMGKRFPLLYLWLGLAIGHLLLPLVISNGKPPVTP